MLKAWWLCLNGINGWWLITLKEPIYDVQIISVFSNS